MTESLSKRVLRKFWVVRQLPKSVVKKDDNVSKTRRGAGKEKDKFQTQEARQTNPREV
jgi:hypothetical protein